MKYLVTGGAGFIGSHLIEYLVDKNHDVVCLDDLSSGVKSNLCKVIKKIDFYEKKIEFFDLNKLKNINAVVHLAAQASVPLSIMNFAESSTSNLVGAIKIIDFCKSNQIPLIYASSSAIYGNLEFGNDEKDSISLLSPYATDKYTIELYSKIAYNTYNLSSIGLRFYNVYGPRQNPANPYSGVISIFADRLKKRQNITINGGFQTRDFIYVKDVADIIYRATILACEKTIYVNSNVLTGTSTSIDKLADMMMKIFKVEVKKLYQNLPKGDPVISKGSIKKMVKLFKINPNNFLNLNEGLTLMANYIPKQQISKSEIE